MAKHFEISFRDTATRKLLTGRYKVTGGIITVTAADGRRAIKLVGDSPPETLAQLLLRELEVKKPKP